MFFRPLQVFGLVAPFLAFSATAAASALSRRATVCNGHSELCEKTYGTVSYVGAHNSYAVGVNNLAVNQDHDVTQQLTDGIRLLQLQAHNQNGGIQLCHSSCSLFNGGSLQDYLVKVKTWMDANPNEVVTILIVNINNQPATAFDAAYKAAGLDAVSFIPETAVIPASGWPTLGSMIDSGRRLVTFLDNQADPSVPYLMDEFTNIWETQFNVVTTFDCNVNRTRGETATQMYLVNHFLNKIVFGQPAPDPDRANTTNAVSGPNSLGDQVEQCAGQHNKPPTFMLVDFYEFGGGSVFQVAATINGVAYNPTTPVATPRSTGTGSGATPTTSASSRPIGGDNGALSLGVQPLFLLVGGLLLGSYVVL